MFDPKRLEQIVKQIQESMPAPVKALGQDVEQKVREVIQSKLIKLDVVSREEFDVQTQVLLRTRKKLNEMEKKLNELEQKLNQTHKEIE